MADKTIENEIKDIKARLEIVEKHVNSCKEHEETKGHKKEHRSH